MADFEVTDDTVRPLSSDRYQVGKKGAAIVGVAHIPFILLSVRVVILILKKTPLRFHLLHKSGIRIFFFFFESLPSVFLFASIFVEEINLIAFLFLYYSVIQ